MPNRFRDENLPFLRRFASRMRRQLRRSWQVPVPGQKLVWLLMQTGGLVCGVSLHLSGGMATLVLVPLIVLTLALTQGLAGAFIGASLQALTALLLASTDHGPLAGNPALLALLCMGLFAMALPPALMLSTQRQRLLTLADREYQLSLLADNVTDAVMVVGFDGRCRYASSWAEQLFSRSRWDLVGGEVIDLIHPDDLPAFLSMMERLETGRSDRETITYRRRTNREGNAPLYIEATCGVLRHGAAGTQVEFISSARDVTDRVMLQRQLEKARIRAEQAAEAKSRFLANMSHEIRTPMNGVLGFAELLQQADLLPEQRQQVDLIAESGRSMMQLLNDILDISKVEAGQVQLKQETIHLAQLAESCRNIFSAHAAQKGIGIRTSLAPGVPPVVEGDALRLRQILLNLLGNAVKFTERGVVELAIGTKGSQLVLAVSDTGIGIEPEQLERIFQPFEQGSTETARRYGGTGLGLTISRQLTQLMHGRLTASSTPGQGSRFTLALPLRIASAGVSATTNPAPPAPLLPGRGGARILLAEDHDINQVLISTMVERCGYQVEIAQDGQEAVETVIEAHASANPFALVLMDIQMPRRDGFAATRIIREAGIPAAELPIIAITANAFEEDVRAALLAGMQGHLAKPMTLSDIAQMLDRWLPARAGGTPSTPPRSSPPTLEERWQQRRRKALHHIGRAMRQGALAQAELQDLIREVHKLAGTAGHFGEPDFGALAGELERALRSGSPPMEITRLAERLLRAA